MAFIFPALACYATILFYTAFFYHWFYVVLQIKKNFIDPDLRTMRAVSMSGAAEPLRHSGNIWLGEARLASFCHSISIPAYIVTYDVILWSVNLRNIITDKINVGYFRVRPFFL